MTKLSWFRQLLAVTVIAFSISLPAGAETPGVVYHIDDSDRALRAIRNISNHRKVYPDLPITVVALAEGVKFMVDGSKDSRGNSYDAMIEPLSMQGVQFKACGNTLKALGVEPDDLAFGVEVVPSGVAEIGRLQLEEGYAYIKP
jgi:uncharacterized protein